MKSSREIGALSQHSQSQHLEGLVPGALAYLLVQAWHGQEPKAQSRLVVVTADDAACEQLGSPA